MIDFGAQQILRARSSATAILYRRRQGRDWLRWPSTSA